jgi:hypothetical protein
MRDVCFTLVLYALSSIYTILTLASVSTASHYHRSFFPSFQDAADDERHILNSSLYTVRLLDACILLRCYSSFVVRLVLTLESPATRVSRNSIVSANASQHTIRSVRVLVTRKWRRRPLLLLLLRMLILPVTRCSYRH